MRRTVQIVVGTCAAWIVVTAAIGVGIRVPHAADLGSLPNANRFDLLRVTPGTLAPLELAFVASILGPDVPAEQPSSVVPKDSPDAPPPGRLPGVGAIAEGAPAGRTVVSHPLSNDRRDQAYEIPAVPFTARSDTRAAQREPGDPSDCAPHGGTVWYAFTPDRDMRLLASTTGSDYATALAVYDDGRTVGCEVDASGSAQVAFPARTGRRYLFQISGPLGGGRLVFNLDSLGTIRRFPDMPEPAHQAAGGPSLSGDGRTMVYLGSDVRSCEPDVPLCRAQVPAILVVDLPTGRVRPMLTGWEGEPVDGASWNPRISYDGRHVTFSSEASNLVRSDTNAYEDVFVHDLVTGRTERVSVSSTGSQGTLPLTWLPEALRGSPSHYELSQQSQAISRDGRYVVFTSALSGLVADDAPDCSTIPPHQRLPGVAGYPRPTAPVDAPGHRCRDVFVRDRHLQKTVRVSVSSDGAPARGSSGAVDISADGRFVVFSSDAPGLVPDDGGWHSDVFVHDRDADEDGMFDEPGGVRTAMVSRTPDGAPAAGNSTPSAYPGAVSISADGRWIAFVSDAEDLVPGDDNGHEDVFLHDRVSGTNRRVATAYGPVIAPSGLSQPWDIKVALSGDGRFLVYDAPASDSADAASHVDTCNWDNIPMRDIHVHDRDTGADVVLTIGPDGQRANGGSFSPAISADARYVGFGSTATNLDPPRRPQDERCDDPTPTDRPQRWLFLYERATQP